MALSIVHNIRPRRIVQRQEDVHDHERTTPPPMPASEAVSRDPVHHSSFRSRAGRPEEVDGHAPLSSDQMTSADQARAFPSCAATVECCAPIMKSTSLSLVQPESAVAE